MVSRKPIVAVALVSMLLIGAVGPVAAHSWQTTVTQGEMELGVSSSPETPVAGMQTDFSARIADESPEGDENRTDFGSVTNRAVEVHIRGPDGYHDHVATEIPEDEAHFAWTYMFPTEGNYTMAVVTEIEGQEYAFEFQREVTLLPAEATGEEMEHMSEEMHGVSEDVGETNEKVDSLQTQVEELQTQLEEQNESDHEEESANNQIPGMGIGAALSAAVGAVAFVAGRRV
jgi:hypothetical protein